MSNVSSTGATERSIECFPESGGEIHDIMSWIVLVMGLTTGIGGTVIRDPCMSTSSELDPLSNLWFSCSKSRELVNLRHKINIIINNIYMCVTHTIISALRNFEIFCYIISISQSRTLFWIYIFCVCPNITSYSRQNFGTFSSSAIQTSFQDFQSNGMLLKSSRYVFPKLSAVYKPNQLHSF